VSSTWWMTLANLAFLASFLARDVLLLRLACVLGSALLVVSFLATSPVPWAAVAWQLGFLAIHAGWSVRLWRERRPVPLHRDERRLAEALFPSLSAREVSDLCRRGVWRTGDAGTVLCRQGERQLHLKVLFEGAVVVERDAATVAELQAPRFVGEVAFLLDECASAGVSARGPVRWLEWPAGELREWLKGRPEAWSAVQRAIGADLARKLSRPAP
jgi:hypothetical protein